MINPISKLTDRVRDKTTLEDVAKKIEDARQTGATVFDYEGQSYDISDPAAVEKVLNEIGHKISSLIQIFLATERQKTPRLNQKAQKYMLLILI